jgi:hypothetical protein
MWEMNKNEIINIFSGSRNESFMAPGELYLSF